MTTCCAHLVYEVYGRSCNFYMCETLLYIIFSNLRVLIIIGVILLVCSARLLQYIPRPWRRTKRAGVDKTFGLRRAVSLHSSKDSSPSAVIQASTLHHLISTPARQKV